ncbi:MAG: hypothetical protein AAGH15_27740, partial [Myxococcota bacterium]
LLPDVRGLEATLRGDVGGAVLGVRAAVAPGSPLAAALAEATTVEPSFGELPGGTAIALRRAGGALDATLAEVAGERLPASVLAPLSDSMPAGPWTLALGAGPWLRLAPAPSGEAVDGFVASAYGGALVGALLGCPRATPGDTPCPGVGLERGQGLVLRRGVASEGTRLRDVPSATRVLAGAPEALAHAYIDPAGVPDALRLLGPLADAPPQPASPRPLALTLKREDDALVLEVRATPGAWPALRALAAIGSE